MTLGQEMRWVYSTMLPSQHGATQHMAQTEHMAQYNRHTWHRQNTWHSTLGTHGTDRTHSPVHSVGAGDTLSNCT